MILEKSAIDPEELRGGVLRRHCYIIAKDGIKSVLEDSNYGRACDCKICHNAPWQNLAAEPYREYFKIGPNGQPYKSGYKANEAAYRANRLWLRNSEAISTSTPSQSAPERAAWERWRTLHISEFGLSLTPPGGVGEWVLNDQ
jgi:hypothetical protein